MPRSLLAFRVIGYAEGTSFLLLLLIAMPLKYIWDYSLAVTYVGAAHGGLFVLYVFAVVVMMFMHRWSWLKGLLGILASVVPFGPFLFDRKLIQQ